MGLLQAAAQPEPALARLPVLLQRHGGGWYRGCVLFLWYSRFGCGIALHRVRNVGYLDHLGSLLHFGLCAMITPLGKKVAVEREPEPQQGAIVRPDLYKEPGQIGKVVSLGTGAPHFEFTVKVGDRVLLPDLYQPGEYATEASTLTIVSEKNLLAILEPA